MKTLFYLLAIVLFTFGCKSNESEESEIVETSIVSVEKFSKPIFTLDEANKLLDLPLHCVGTPYPFKPQHTLEGKADLIEPSTVHPIFYGCFDWHSAVHGYWSLVTLLQQFPEMERAEEAEKILRDKITPENVAIEVAFFEKPINKSFERTYGWAWILKLAETLYKWNNPMAQELYNNLKPLTDAIVDRYIEFLPKLNYPVRVGEHPNTAFGLAFAYDYAKTTRDSEFLHLIESRAKDFYFKDKNCTINWEPSGYDFLSPCLEEIDIMRRVLPRQDFLNWMDDFMPELKEKDYHLEVGRVSDRTDGKLVHLDGLNFSRAWVFYGLAKKFPEYKHLENLANEHLAYSYPNVVGDSYEGGHWLGSFAIYALNVLHGE